MDLIARDFECFPSDSTANRLLAPLIGKLDDVRFPVTIGERNSNQFAYGFDLQLEASLIAQGATRSELRLPPGVKQEHDFAFSFDDKQVVVEVEKANWEKILRDFLKFHVYFAHGAAIALLFLPKSYPHSNGDFENFKAGRKLFQECLEFGFGQPSTFDRILLVGYEQVTVNGERFTSAVRNQWRAAAADRRP